MTLPRPPRCGPARAGIAATAPAKVLPALTAAALLVFSLGGLVAYVVVLGAPARAAGPRGLPLR